MRKKTFTPKLTGGEYIAEQNPDGTWNIKDVPIFAEHEIDEKKKIGKQWMEKAIKRAKELYEENKYLAPLHINHHNSGKDVQPAGFIFPKEVIIMQINGEDKYVMTADFISVPDEVYKLIKNNRLPYRSVEIHDIDNPEISSLALLSTDIPFFKFPLLRIAKEVKEAEMVSASLGEPLLAYREIHYGKNNKNGRLFLFNFGGNCMTKESKKYYEEEEKEKEEKEKIIGEEKEEKEKEEEKMEEKEKIEVSPMQKLLEDINSKLDKLIALLIEEEEEEEGGGGEWEEDEEKDKEPPKQKSDTTPIEVSASEIAMLKGQIKALEHKVKKYEDKERYSQIADNVIKELREYGVNKDDKQEIIKILEKHGEEGLEIYKASVKKYSIKEPKSFEEEFGEEQSEIKEYLDKSPSDLEKIKFYTQQYKILKAGGKTNKTLKAFIEDMLYADNLTKENFNEKVS